MIFELTWHGPVCDVTYSVEADTEEDAMQEICRALNEDDERWLRAHEIQRVWSEADEHDEAEESENPLCPECGDRLCASEPKFYPFCVPCGDKLAALVDGATTTKDEEP